MLGPVANGATIGTSHIPVDEQPSATGAADAPLVILVHGSLDRAESFRRVLRRLPDMNVVTYDRRGYQRSRGAGPTDLVGHCADLIALLGALVPEHGPGTLVGHSFGGDVVLGVACTRPHLVGAIGAYEPPVPWLGFRRSDAAASAPGAEGMTTDPGAEHVAVGPGEENIATDPGAEAERFFARMIGRAAWDRLGGDERASRRADGPALQAELASIRGAAPFDVTALSVPAVFGRGGERSLSHHRAGTQWLVDNVPGSELFEIPTAGHGAHLSHPDAFAAFVRRAVARTRPWTIDPTATGAARRADDDPDEIGV